MHLIKYLRIRKLWYIYTMEYYSAIKKNSFEGPMLILKLQYFGHLMQRANSWEKTLMLGKIEGRIYGIWKDGNDNPVCETAKETQMYRTVFWTLWERERVG